MVTTTLLRRSIGLALGLSLAAAPGCAVVTGVVDGLGDERSRPPSDRALTAAGIGEVTDALRGGEEGASESSASSGYLASPALTWGELQRHRPHAITGSLFNRWSTSGHRGCRPTLQPYEATGVPTSSHAEQLAHSGPAWLGFGGTSVRLETAFTFDREVRADQAMRSGAFLVQQGPLCSRALFLSLTIGGGRNTVAVHW